MSAKLSNSDISAWVMNVLSCVAIIMVNKQLMSSQGYAFNFSTTLCGLHFIVTGCASRLLKRYQDGRPQDRTAADEEADRSAAKDKKSTLPLSDLIIFVVVANLSIVSLNTSLMVNTVSLYQIAKLGIPPVTAVVERVWFGNALSGLQILAMAITLAGIGLVTVAELNVTGNTSFGVMVAMISVLSSSSQQILCGHYQRKNAMSSNDFLNAVSMWQGISCLAVGPILDVIISGKWVFSYSFTLGSFSFLVLSCLNSVLVNASHFMYVTPTPSLLLPTPLHPPSGAWGGSVQ